MYIVAYIQISMSVFSFEYGRAQNMKKKPCYRLITKMIHTTEFGIAGFFIYHISSCLHERTFPSQLPVVFPLCDNISGLYLNHPSITRTFSVISHHHHHTDHQNKKPIIL